LKETNRLASDGSKASGEKKKTKKQNEKKRASTSIVTLIKETGRVDFDPKGLFSKDKKKLTAAELEQYSLELLSPTHEEKSERRKKEDRRSQKKQTHKKIRQKSRKKRKYSSY